MRILTLNTWGKAGPFEARFQAIAHAVSRMRVDLCCLQEVVDPRLLDRIGTGAGLVHRCLEPENGLAILSRWNIESQWTMSFRTRSSLERHGRGAAIASVGGLAGVIVACTHLSFRPEDASTRQDQVNELLHMIERFDQPRVLAGDLNDTPESPTIRAVQARNMVDAFGRLCPQADGFTWAARNPFTFLQDPMLPDRRIDYIFVDERLGPRLSAAEVVFDRPDAHGNHASDHFGVLVDLR